MTKFHKLGLFITLAGMSATSFAAANCNSLISKGSQKSVTTAAQGVSLSDVNSCMAQCDYMKSTGDPTQDAAQASLCIGSLSTLKYAVNYLDSNIVSPDKFVSAPGMPGPSGFSSALKNSGSLGSSGSAYSQQSVNNDFSAAQSTPAPSPAPSAQTYSGNNQQGFSVNANAMNKLKASAQKNNHIRWY
jgi:hypothetical protein